MAHVNLSCSGCGHVPAMTEVTKVPQKSELQAGEMTASSGVSLKTQNFIYEWQCSKCWIFNSVDPSKGPAISTGKVSGRDSYDAHVNYGDASSAMTALQQALGNIPGLKNLFVGDNDTSDENDSVTGRHGGDKTPTMTLAQCIRSGKHGQIRLAGKCKYCGM